MITDQIQPATLQILHGDCREQLKSFENQVDLIMTSPPYADARKQHYASVAPDDYADWFSSFHEVFWRALKPTGSLVVSNSRKLAHSTS